MRLAVSMILLVLLVKLSTDYSLNSFIEGSMEFSAGQMDHGFRGWHNSSMGK